jgi:hypothetical protein
MEHSISNGVALLDQRPPATRIGPESPIQAPWLGAREAGRFLALVDRLTTPESSVSALPALPAPRDWSRVTRLGGFL